MVLCMLCVPLSSGCQDRSGLFGLELQWLFQEKHGGVPRLQTAHQAQHRTGQSAVIHWGSDDDVVKIIVVNDLHPVLYHALRRLPATAAVHAGGNAGAECRNFNDLTLKMPPQHVDQIGCISVWAGRSVDDNCPFPHHILPSAESNSIRTKSNTCGNNSSLFSSVM